MTEITIPNYRLVQDVKPHYVYTINVLSPGGYQECVERRYSAFHAFHREVRVRGLPLFDRPLCAKGGVFTRRNPCIYHANPCFTAQEVHVHSAVPVETHQVLTAQSPGTKTGRPGEVFADRVQNRGRLQTRYGISRFEVSAQVNTTMMFSSVRLHRLLIVLFYKRKKFFSLFSHKIDVKYQRPVFHLISEHIPSRNRHEKRLCLPDIITDGVLKGLYS